MTNVNDLIVGAADLRDGASAELLGDLVESLDLSLCLDFVEGVAVGGVTDTKTVDG